MSNEAPILAKKHLDLYELNEFLIRENERFKTELEIRTERLKELNTELIDAKVEAARERGQKMVFELSSNHYMLCTRFLVCILLVLFFGTLLGFSTWIFTSTP